MTIMNSRDVYIARYDVNIRGKLKIRRRSTICTMDDSQYSLVNSVDQTRLRGEHFVKLYHRLYMVILRLLLLEE